MTVPRHIKNDGRAAHAHPNPARADGSGQDSVSPFINAFMDKLADIRMDTVIFVTQLLDHVAYLVGETGM